MLSNSLKVGSNSKSLSTNIPTAFLEHSLVFLPSGSLPITLSGSPFFAKFGLTIRCPKKRGNGRLMAKNTVIDFGTSVKFLIRGYIFGFVSVFLSSASCALIAAFLEDYPLSCIFMKSTRLAAESDNQASCSSQLLLDSLSVLLFLISSCRLGARNFGGFK